MTLGERLSAVLDGLPAGWAEARVVLSVVDAGRADRAAALLGPLGPGRTGTTFRLRVTPAGVGGPSREAALRVLERLESEGIDARLTVPDGDAYLLSESAPPPPAPSLAASWDDLAARLPADWSDLHLELELASSGDIERGALLLGPTNPFLFDGPRPRFRFRSARLAGYGAAPTMVRRSLARLDEEGIRGRLELRRVRCDTRHVLTQGPVWREGGRSV
ncbi:MAG: hypothetical protein IT201_09020 [Thermoleophilia bacterium]|nr:hypothetical protein [Thermoleophilia bacterium]